MRRGSWKPGQRGGTENGEKTRFQDAGSNYICCFRKGVITNPGKPGYALKVSKGVREKAKQLREGKSCLDMNRENG